MALIFSKRWLFDFFSVVFATMAYGVIGNTAVSGTVVLGSSPGIPALIATPRSVWGRACTAGPPATPMELDHHGVDVTVWCVNEGMDGTNVPDYSESTRPHRIAA